jgi:hypothetical protein
LQINRISPLYIDYQVKYNSKSFFLDLSDESNKFGINIPMTLESKGGINILNYYGKSITINANSDHEKNLLTEYILHLNQKYQIQKYNVKYPVICFEENFKIYSNKLVEEMFIDLSNPEKVIFKNFKQSSKTVLNKIYNELNYQIIDYLNYNGEIEEMRKLHIKIANKETRSKETWLINEKMICNQEGFLIKVDYNNNPISYSFFFYNEYLCEYFSSVTIREYFKQFTNITHKSLWLAIQYIKGNCKFFYLGDRTFYSNNLIGEKEKNIEKFKYSFHEFTQKYLILENFDNLFFFLKNKKL